VATTGYTKNFVVKNGITTGSITLDANSGNITGTNLSVTGLSNLGNIGNVKITGGNSGQAIVTDGTGNLSFANASATSSPAPMPTYIAVGDDVVISANYQGLFGYPITIDGELTVDGVLIDVNDNRGSEVSPGGLDTQVQFNDASTFGGNAGFTFNKTTGIFTAPYLAGNGNGLSNIQGANVSGAVSFATIANAVAGANVSGAVSFATTANSVAGANVTGQVNFAATANAVAGSNVSGAVSYATTANSVAGANVSGAVNLANYATTANSVAGANVSGQVNFAATANSVAGANVSGAVSYATTANAVAGSNVSGAVSYATTANAVAGANVSGAVNLATYATTANGVAGANVSGAVSFATTANSVAGANVSGAVSYATIANAVAGANVSGPVAFATTANSVAGANVSGEVNLATYATTANAVAGANVSGAVSFATTANSVAGANVSGAVSTATTAGTVTTAAQPNITSVGTLTSLTVNGNISANNANITGNIVPTSNNTYSLGSASSYWKDAYIGPGSLYINGVKVLEESSNAIVISADLNQTVKVTSSGSGDIQLQTTGSGVIAVKGPLQIQAGNYITSSNGGPIGFSNPINVDTLSSLSANTNLTISANGTGNIQINDDVTITGNLTINGGGGNLSVSSLTVEDNIIDISAETTGVPVNNAGIRVIRGDEPSVQNRWNETTETWQITNDGSTYLNVVGSNTSTGNANVGNIGATGGIFTTVAGSLTTNAQPNITSTGILSSLSVSGNANTGNIGTNNLVASGTGSFSANVNMNGQWINNVGYPNLETDAASKLYVDTLVSTGISYHPPVNVATTTTLAIATGGTTSYNSPNGAANGIGAYISTTGTFLLIDGANVQTVGTRILVKDEANATWNGVYTYANTTAIVRSTDTDTYAVDLNQTQHMGINDYFFTLGGVVNEGTSFIVSAPTGTITFGTSNIVFSTFSTSQIYDAGTGLSLTGTTFSVNASQTQVTALGTLSSLSVSGNANVGNIGAINGVFTNVSGNGSALTSITGSNVTGQVSFAATANAVAGGNVTGQVSFAATSNAVAGANVSGEVNFAATANSVAGANVSGAVSFATTANSVAGSNVSGAVNLANFASTANSVAGANVSGAVSFATTANAVAGANVSGAVSFATTANAVAGANVSGAVNLANFASTANAVAGGNVSGAVSFATTANAVAGGNVSGQVGNALVASTVYTSAQPNITSVGTLTSLAVTGNISAANVTATHYGAATGLTGIPGANVTGQVGNALVAGTVYTAAQPNITSVGTLTSLAVTGNISAANVTATHYGAATGLTGIPGANVTGQVGNALVSGTVYTAAQPNITSVGTLTGLTVSSTISGSVNGTSATVTTAAQPNITSVGTLTSLGISGSITSTAATGLTMNLTGTNSANLIYAQMGDNDQFRILVGASATNAGFVEIATADDGTEPIYVRQYTGVFTTVARTATLLDSSGHTTFPGNVTGANLTTAGTLTAATVTETSSLALKENFRPIENPLEKVMQLLGKIYDRKDGSSKDEAGLVAEDVYKIIPNLVKTDSNGNPESVLYSRLSVYLLESIKVLNDEIAELKGKKRKSKK
jgi:hypothetical protein